MGAVLALIRHNNLIFFLLAATLTLFLFQLVALAIDHVLLLEVAELALLKLFLCSDQGHFLLLNGQLALKICLA